MNNGLFLPISKFLIKILNYINLVEFYKLLLVSIFSNSNQVNISRIAIDSFIILKFIFLIYLMYFEINNCLVNILVWYLLISNIYTYFYYHIWKDDSVNNHYDTPERIRRRFLNLGSSIIFSNLCFAYLYRYQYYDNFKWDSKYSIDSQAIWYSVANSLTVGYKPVEALDKIGADFSIFQLIISFVFLTMILSNSIPKTNN